MIYSIEKQMINKNVVIVKENEGKLKVILHTKFNVYLCMYWLSTCGCEHIVKLRVSKIYREISKKKLAFSEKKILIYATEKYSNL